MDALGGRSIKRVEVFAVCLGWWSFVSDHRAERAIWNRAEKLRVLRLPAELEQVRVNSLRNRAWHNQHSKAGRSAHRHVQAWP